MDLPVPEPTPLLGSVVDSHCHLGLTERKSGLTPQDALTAAASVGVTGIVDVGVDVTSSQRAVEQARAHHNVWGAVVGIHPNAAPDLVAAGSWESDFAAIAEMAQDDVVIGIGETGLDYFRTGEDGVADQKAAFAAHIELAKELNQTLVIHDRDAHADVLTTLLDVGAPERVVFHCFSADADYARTVTDRGWFVSFSGVVTFKNAKDLQAAAVAAPLDRILVETDAPYLTPQPNRGKSNASYLLPWTVRQICDLKQIDEVELAAQVTRNTRAAFGLDD